MRARQDLPLATGPSPELVVLSARASRRFGGRPKALLPIGDDSAVGRILRVGRDAGFERAIVVVGAHTSELSPALRGTDAVIVENPAWAAGRTGSVQCGLRATTPGADVLLWPVDRPFAEANTLRTLRAAAQADLLATWLIPTFEEKGGHPVWLKSAALPSVLALPVDAPLRWASRRLGPLAARVAVRDPGILLGTDSPDEYRASLRSWDRGG